MPAGVGRQWRVGGPCPDERVEHRAGGDPERQPEARAGADRRRDAERVGAAGEQRRERVAGARPIDAPDDPGTGVAAEQRPDQREQHEPDDPDVQAHQHAGACSVGGGGEERAELAEDARRRAPHGRAVADLRELVGAVPDAPFADVPLQRLDRRAGQERRQRRLDDALDLPLVAASRAAGAPRRRGSGVTRKLLTGIQKGSSSPSTRRPIDAGSSPTSSLASRSAVATRSASPSSAAPPGNETSPEWCPS